MKALDRRITLWVSGNPPLYVGMGEYLAESEFSIKNMSDDGPSLLIVTPNIKHKADAVRKEAYYGHYFLISTELHDQAAEFWPFRFWLRGVGFHPEIVMDGEYQSCYLLFEYEEEKQNGSKDQCLCVKQWAEEQMDV